MAAISTILLGAGLAAGAAGTANSFMTANRQEGLSRIAKANAGLDSNIAMQIKEKADAKRKEIYDSYIEKREGQVREATTMLDSQLAIATQLKQAGLPDETIKLWMDNTRRTAADVQSVATDSGDALTGAINAQRMVSDTAREISSADAQTRLQGAKDYQRTLGEVAMQKNSIVSQFEAEALALNERANVDPILENMMLTKGFADAAQARSDAFIGAAMQNRSEGINNASNTLLGASMIVPEGATLGGDGAKRTKSAQSYSGNKVTSPLAFNTENTSSNDYAFLEGNKAYDRKLGIYKGVDLPFDDGSGSVFGNLDPWEIASIGGTPFGR
jgi:hypothetical protein